MCAQVGRGFCVCGGHIASYPTADFPALGPLSATMNTASCFAWPGFHKRLLQRPQLRERPSLGAPCVRTPLARAYAHAPCTLLAPAIPHVHAHRAHPLARRAPPVRAHRAPLVRARTPVHTLCVHPLCVCVRTPVRWLFC